MGNFDEQGFRNAALKRGANPDTVEMYVQAIKAHQSSTAYQMQQQGQNLDLLNKQQSLQQGDLQLKNAQLNYDKSLRENQPIDVNKYMTQSSELPDLSQLLIKKDQTVSSNNAPIDYNNIQSKVVDKTPQEMGILSKISNFLFPNATKMAGNVGSSLMTSAGQIGDVITGVNPFASQESKINAGKHFVESQKKQEEIKKQMTLPNIARTAAEAASWMVPGSKGAKALVSGATRGALNATSRPNMTQKDLENAIVLGALTEGTLSNLGPIKNFVSGKIKKIPGAGNLEGIAKDIEQGTRQIRVKPSIHGAGIEETINETLNKYGAKGGAANQYKQLKPIIDKIEKNIGEEITNNPNVSVPVKKIGDIFNKGMISPIRSGEMTKGQAGNYAKQYLTALIKEAGGTTDGEISTEGIRALKRLINQDYSGVASAKEAGRALTPMQHVIESAWNSIDDAMKEANPKIWQLLKDESNIYKAANPLSNARFNPPTLRAAGFSLFKPVTQAIRDTATGALRIPGKLSQGIDNMASGVSSALPPIVVRNTPRIATSGILSSQNSDNASQNPNENYPSNINGDNAGITNNNEGNNIDSQGNHVSNYNTSNTGSQYITGKSPQEWFIAAQNAMQDNNPTAYKYFKDLADTELAQQNKTGVGKEPVTIDRFADDLKKLYFFDNKNGISIGDKTVGVGGILPRIGVEYDKKMDQKYADNLARYNQARSVFAGLLNRARGAGTLNQGEYETVIKNMPNEYTSKRVAEAWFNDVKTLLRGIDISKSQVSIQPE